MLPLLTAGSSSFAKTFLPYGSGGRPSLHADFAIAIADSPSLINNADFDVVDERPGLVLGRGTPPPSHPGRIFLLDAGPFATASDAADALLRWVSEYWECERVTDEQNSCFGRGRIEKMEQQQRRWHLWVNMGSADLTYKAPAS